ncbi:MAG: ferritin family protein [Clostridiales bacterium]|jgi:rubrerythrin|nr:ferritin family protein [Clostridiales bacterium]
MDKIKKILSFAMRMEKNSMDFYEFYIDKDVSTEASKLFESLADTERQHFNILKEQYDKLGFTEAPIDISWVVDETFKARDPHILADNSDMIAAYNENISDISVMRMAYLIETDFSYFYDKAVKQVEDAEVKKLLSELAKWEKQHSELFYGKYLDLLDKEFKDLKILLE